MASFKYLINSFSCFQAATILVLLIALSLSVHTQKADAQGGSCSAELSSLNVCAPFVVPGSTNTNPSSDCCSALQAVHPECICNAVRVAARLPAQCNLSPLTCDTN
ncbi:unnamed protein product [Malus baccata var. baccata]|uniref:Bifunctional inhibitor/plant lipid transfer protein/seed storage helical domain-containing protein n=1 Tax=Malus baccata TaxID=106549 RepID=A0A540MYU8_MALBA|nr:protein MEN-8-like [Malus domestica]TQE03954.1 hypothetical protein C1H46_010481 [Malus baccata]